MQRFEAGHARTRDAGGLGGVREPARHRERFTRADRCRGRGEAHQHPGDVGADGAQLLGRGSAVRPRRRRRPAPDRGRPLGSRGCARRPDRRGRLLAGRLHAAGGRGAERPRAASMACPTATSPTSSSTAPTCSRSTAWRCRETMDELTAAALAIQAAVRAEGNDDFYGITLRGAPNCGLNFWIIGSTWGPSWGVRWYDDAGRPTLDTPELRGAVEHYCDLLWRAGPPQSAQMTFIDCTECLRGRSGGDDGRARQRGVDPVRLRAARSPRARARRSCRSGRSARATSACTARRTRSPRARPSKRAAWELAKFLCAPEQVLDDAPSAAASSRCRASR